VTGTPRRNPVRDRVAIVGVGTTQYSRSGVRSRTALAVDAAMAAIEDAGISRDEVDGLAGNADVAAPAQVQAGLGLPSVRWWSATAYPFSLLLTDAVNAVFSGSCDVCVVYHAQFRTVASSSSAAASDPTRAVPDPGRAKTGSPLRQYSHHLGHRRGSYAGFMRRYMHEYGVSREPFGMVAVNGRTMARTNAHAAMREPLDMAGYLGGRMVRDPMCVYDMDYVVDTGDAVVVTSAGRARDLPHRPVLVHASSFGAIGANDDDQYPALTDTGQEVAAAGLWSKSEVTVADVDLVFPYDGFSIITLKWLEALGFCGPGEAGELLRDSWDEAGQRLLLGGRVPVNTHGGSLSEGASQGAGHVREAVVQLRHEAGERQVPRASVAALGVGGLFSNSSALVLRNQEGRDRWT
jgi:acetyl-CoA acetyltransferase